MPFDSHMKAACTDILIFILHGVILGVSSAGPGAGLGDPFKLSTFYDSMIISHATGIIV